MYIRSIKKTISVVMLFLCFCSFLVCASGKSSEQTPMGQQANAEQRGAERIVLYDKPSDQGNIVGYYRQGAPVKVIDESSLSWVRVEIGLFAQAGRFIGYMRKDQLIKTEEPIPPTNITVGVVHSNGNGVALREAPEEASLTMGRYLDGTRVCIWGVLTNGWAHVAFGRTAGFLPQACLIDTGEPPTIGTNYVGSAIGYVITCVRSQEPDSMKNFLFPSISSEMISPATYSRTMYNGYTHTLVGELDDWYQLGSSMNAHCSFVQKNNYNAYLLEDLLISADIALGKGTYQAGKDIPAGLYTFIPLDNTIGLINVSAAGNNLDQDFAIAGPCTFYAPDGAIITVASEGTLSQMENKPVVTIDKPFLGSGRFFLGIQIPCDFQQIILRPIGGDSPSLYRMDNLNGTKQEPPYPVPTDDLHEADFPGYKRLQDGEEYSITMSEGLFIEIQNTELSLHIPLG